MSVRPCHFSFLRGLRVSGDDVRRAVLDVEFTAERIDAETAQPIQFFDALLDLIVQFIHNEIGAS